VKHREESSGSELVERLRRSGGRHADSLENEAADRIEELERAAREARDLLQAVETDDELVTAAWLKLSAVLEKDKQRPSLDKYVKWYEKPRRG
jgi:hypothetical protein